MGTPTIIIDTNVLVSALGWKGAPRTILARTLNGEFALVTCAEQLDELDRVLSYPKLAFTRDERTRFRSIISRRASIIEPPALTPFSVDPSDTMFLALANASHAQYLITGDRHLARIGIFERTMIVSPRGFLETQRMVSDD